MRYGKQAELKHILPSLTTATWGIRQGPLRTGVPSVRVGPNYLMVVG